MDGEIATIERDLMLSYIRQLYETFHQMDGNGTVASPKSRAAKVKQNPDLEITNRSLNGKMSVVLKADTCHPRPVHGRR